jgi:hypothetical protein
MGQMGERLELITIAELHSFTLLLQQVDPSFGESPVPQTQSHVRHAHAHVSEDIYVYIHIYSLYCNMRYVRHLVSPTICCIYDIYIFIYICFIYDIQIFGQSCDIDIENVFWSVYI